MNEFFIYLEGYHCKSRIFERMENFQNDYCRSWTKKPFKNSYSRQLRMFALIVSSHPYCARKFACHVIHRARAPSTKLNNDRADGHSYSFDCI